MIGFTVVRFVNVISLLDVKKSEKKLLEEIATCLDLGLLNITAGQQGNITKGERRL